MAEKISKKEGDKLLYIADPMCSWCWGFAPTLKAIEEHYPQFEVQLVLGGLAPDSDEPMQEETKQYIQQAWRDVSRMSGAEFNYDFWENCAPKRSTWIACRAVIVGRNFQLEREMFEAIQRAYYLEAKNPSEAETLANLAEGLGIPRESFLQMLNAKETQALLEEDFDKRRKANTHSFPSLALQKNGEFSILLSGYCSPQDIHAHLKVQK